MPSNKNKQQQQNKREQKFRETFCKCFNNFIWLQTNPTSRDFSFSQLFSISKATLGLFCAILCVCVCVTKMFREPTGQPKERLHVCKERRQKKDEKQTFETISKRSLSFFHLITMLTFSHCVLSYSGWVRFLGLKCVCMLIVVLRTFFSLSLLK